MRHDITISANELNNDLKKINGWAFQWKISFNPDPSKQYQEVIFSRKLKNVSHPTPTVFKTSSTRLAKTSSRRLQELLQRYLQDVFNTYH